MRKRKSLTKGERVLGGKYEVLRKIHEGGMSNVYIVMDTSLNTYRCLKEIKKPKSKNNYKSEKEYKRAVLEYSSLLSESQHLSKLNFPSIPRIFSITNEGDSVYILMDFVEGMSLRRIQEMKGQIDQRRVINWGIQIANIMIYLHSDRKSKPPMLYRDLKPENLMLQDDGQIKLLDFGISMFLDKKENYLTHRLGTKGYAPPELYIQGGKADLRSDIFSFGRTLISLLTGLNLSAMPEKDLKKLDLTYFVPNISQGLVEILHKCCEEKVEDRFGSFEEVLYELQNYEKRDSEYIKSIKRKIKIVYSLALVGILLIVISLTPFYLSKAEKEKRYEASINRATQSEKVEDWETVIEMKPDNFKYYPSYIESLKQDGKFTKKEESNLIGYLSQNSAKDKEDKEYGRVAYDTAKLYWIYYEDKEQGEILSVKWFNDAIKNKYNVKESKVFYEIGSFRKNIMSAVVESNDGGMYSKYWKSLVKARGYANNELSDLTINETIVDAINIYSARLKGDGITKQQMLGELNKTKKFLNERKTHQFKDKYDNLQQMLDSGYSVVETTFDKGGLE